ncbi:MAG: twin-arginine translocase TatA/TatE family subunit [Candidatus Thermofonsia Clade 1 bacterium]|jgi:sec-independent protein translocase protein TatA|uniref:Sec-independent protein translocase protein TatA n=1 Tax=Candidatus Thermofonsia Clade 1 bacterium TaxID=2364210 RepID=A0A2M8P0Y6_9CHLR|nr:MAG: twin-arginine translocase TatA/TatE family subunit [Candidatus Thermofonsia Clade 1 bacterium]
MNLGPTELLIILVIIVVLFGAGRIGRLGRELGTAVREFRRGVSDGDKPAEEQKRDLPDPKA